MPVDVGGRAQGGKVLLFLKSLHEAGVKRSAAYEEVKTFVNELEFDRQGSVVKSRISYLISQIFGSKSSPKPMLYKTIGQWEAVLDINESHPSTYTKSMKDQTGWRRQAL